jgi:hypothetical protein
MDDLIRAVAGLRRNEMIRQAQRRQRVRAAEQHGRNGSIAAHPAAGTVTRCWRWIAGKRQVGRFPTT